MSFGDETDALRDSVLHRIDQAQQRFRVAFVGAAVMEGLLLGAFLLLMDFKQRVHVLMLVQAVLIYGTLAIGLMALGAYQRVQTLRLLQAIEAVLPGAHARNP